MVTRVTAAHAGLLSCLTCGLVVRPLLTPRACKCPRCGTHLAQRKPWSLQRTWMLLITAMIFYVPANALPIMTTRSLLSEQSDTILSGVVFLWSTGSWVIAIIVFIASIMVPLLKILALTTLLLSVQHGLVRGPLQRARLFRLVSIVGRWSMLDIYVVALLVTLVQVQSVATIEPGGAALAFGAVVVLTMLATASFDPRLIWDQATVSNRDGSRRHG